MISFKKKIINEKKHSSSNNEQIQKQINILNNKLDKILGMLESGLKIKQITKKDLTEDIKEDNTIIYTQKCIDLYEKDAIKQQESLSNYAPKERAFDYWALCTTSFIFNI